MSSLLDLQLQQTLDERKLQHSLRQLSIHDGLIDFCSNDYLGLSRIDSPSESIEPDLVRKNGATGSRLLRGNSKVAQELEVSLA